MTNFALPSHVSKRWVVSVESSTGEVLSPAAFEFFGAATAPGAGAVAMRSTPGESQTVLTLSPLGQAGTWHYSIFCRQKVTAVTWQVASGQISVTPSPCLAQPSLDPAPVLLTAMLDPQTLQITVSLGDSVVATTAAAQQASQAAAAAQDSQAAAAQSASNAQDSQAAAAQSAAAAQDSQTAAAQSASNAQSAKDQAEQAADDAQTSKAAAAQSASNAQSAKTQAEQAADDAQTSKAAAAQSASKALSAKTQAEQAADDAQTSKAAAAQSASNAQSAKTQAEQAAEKAAADAALLGDAALKAADNSFSGTNTFNGPIQGAGNIFGIPLNKLVGDDFFCFQFFTTQREVLEYNPELPNLTRFACKLGEFKTKNMNVKYTIDGSSLQKTSKLKDLFIWTKGTPGENYHFTIGGDFDEYVLINEQAESLYRPVSNSSKKSVFILPALTSMRDFFTWTRFTGSLVIYSPKVTDIDYNNSIYTNSKIEELNLVACNALSIKFRNQPIKRVLNTFPQAQMLAMPSAMLDKASVLRVVDSLPAYNAETASSVPELTLGIDPALDGDSEINEALLNAQTAVEDGGKGWNVAVYGFTITAAPEAATLGLRKIIYAQRRVDELGEYVDATGGRWTVRYGHTVLENWQANEQLGYEEFSSLADALEFWGLIDYRDPEPPEELENA